ncbi:unnamed protein product [Cuscuta epithymum]|uniref:Uncharacterized protein n=1 Tax=Cuscuta epithymum TaxID=186058 RepID=A0AAV0D3P3_9ASTE|nr:unnamed protein product [Cuscuta epithymum]
MPLYPELRLDLRNRKASRRRSEMSNQVGKTVDNGGEFGLGIVNGVSSEIMESAHDGSCLTLHIASSSCSNKFHPDILHLQRRNLIHRRIDNSNRGAVQDISVLAVIFIGAALKPGCRPAPSIIWFSST